MFQWLKDLIESLRETIKPFTTVVFWFLVIGMCFVMAQVISEEFAVIEKIACIPCEGIGNFEDEIWEGKSVRYEQTPCDACWGQGFMTESYKDPTYFWGIFLGFLIPLLLVLGKTKGVSFKFWKFEFYQKSGNTTKLKKDEADEGTSS